jgi:2-keto-4-pentenoate hydratase
MNKEKGIRFWASAFLTIILSLVAGFSYVGAADFADSFTEHFQKKIPVNDVDPQMTMEQARKFQEKFIANLIKEYGDPVGYKAGLTNPVVQKMLGVTHPVRGTLLAKMILGSGAEIPAAFGAVPMTEGDLCVRVSGDAINQAKTPE